MGGKMSYIVRGLYVGGWVAADNVSEQDALGITHILSMITFGAKHTRREKLVIKTEDFVGVDLTDQFEQAIVFIHQARVSGGAVLVNCACGISRSVTFTIAYLIVITNWPSAKLFAALQGARHIANPNPAFLQQLDDFQRSGKAAEIRDRLFRQYGEWSLDRLRADEEDLDRHLVEQQFMLDHGTYRTDYNDCRFCACCSIGRRGQRAEYYE